jgi:hypothetical protein
LVGVPLLIRYLARERSDARLELDQGHAHLSLDFVDGAIQCQSPSGDRRSGALSGRVLAQLLQRGEALKAEVRPQTFPLRELLTQRGLSPDERRAQILELLARACLGREGTFELNFRAPSARLRRAVEGDKTIALQVPHVIRRAQALKGKVGLVAPGRQRRVEGAGRGTPLFLEVAATRRLNGTLTLRGLERSYEVLLADGLGHAGPEAAPKREGVSQLVAWGGGSFSFEARRPAELGAPLPRELLEEFAAQAASWSTLLSLVAGPTAVFAFASTAAETESSQVFGLELVSSIDGRRTLRELCAESDQPLEVVRTVADLVTLGFVQRVS